MTGREERVVNRVKRTVITFRHNAYKGHILYCCPNFTKIVEEGPESEFFHFSDDKDRSRAAATNEENDGNDVSVGAEAEVNANKEIPTSVFHATSSKEDIDFVCALIFGVDNDNAPTEENILSATEEEGADNGQENSNNVEAT